MCTDGIDEFRRERERLQTKLQEFAGVNMKRFLGVDNKVYADGALPARTKEMLGFVASLVLRCDDCVNYHLANLQELGVSDAEFEELIAVGMIVGGSITIPHARRAVDAWLGHDAECDPPPPASLAGGTPSCESGNPSAFDALLAELKRIAAGEDAADLKLLRITELLHRSVSHYDWVGFYFVNPDKADELVLGPYTGEPTEHTNIPFGRGICGRVAVTQETLVIQDVAAESNYLSCSPFVNSEIVLPIFVDGKFAGELDIDSHATAPFTDADEAFLQKVCMIAAGLLTQH